MWKTFPVLEWCTAHTLHHLYSHLFALFPFLCGVEAGLGVLFLLWFSPTLGLIARARWRGQVRNNLLALHSYFQHWDRAMNSDMDLALLQRLWFCLSCSHWTAREGHFMMQRKPYSRQTYSTVEKKPELLQHWHSFQGRIFPRSLSFASILDAGNFGRLRANICG